jgi:hypothetical protein
MVKNIIVILLIFSCLVSCFQTRTEYGNIRFRPKRFTIKPNTNDDVYKVIDTSKLYERLNIIDTVYNKKLTGTKKQFLKFYANGRVGEFDLFYEDDVKSLDPKKAKMALYHYDGKDLFIQFYFDGVQGGALLKYKLKKVDEERLELTGYNNLITYKKLSLSQEFLIYKPDW